MEIGELRSKIDAIDRELTRLFDERMRVSAEIAAYKRANALPIRDVARENEKMNAIMKAARPEIRAYLERLYSTIFDLSRDYQNALNAERSMRAGLLGERLGHSFSPRIHAMLGNYAYDLFEIPPEDLDGFLRGNDFDALNVTIPYKRLAMLYCAELTETARAIGSVNTLVRRADGTLLGDNTDAAGFRATLNLLRLSPKGKKALVLGSGGASRAAQYVLREAGFGEVVVISRRGENNYQNLSIHADARLLVNATPVGMAPNCGVSLVNLDDFPDLEGVIDLIYNPARTRLLLAAQARGIPCRNGLYMLAEQARAAAERFTGRTIDLSVSERIRRTLAEETTNIVLIGMPGCGKSTVGAFVAEKCGRELVDTDAVLERKLGVSAAEYLRTAGEAAFRNAETAVLAEVGSRSGLVIASGGGCVTRRENYAHLRQNGEIFFLRRALDLLPTNGRPLSQSGDPAEMYRARLPLYRAFADAEVENDASPDTAADRVLEAYHEILNH